jgi:hypothetical protein
MYLVGSVSDFCTEHRSLRRRGAGGEAKWQVQETVRGSDALIRGGATCAGGGGSVAATSASHLDER